MDQNVTAIYVMNSRIINFIFFIKVVIFKENLYFTNGEKQGKL